MPLDRPLAFVDLETTGGAAAQDRITEVAIVTWDGATMTAWSSLVDPGCRIPPFIAQLTGITDAMVAGAPPFAALADTIAERLDGHLFIAHNARFDYAFLKNEFRRLGRDFRAPVLCTVKYSRRLFPEHIKHNLDSLITRHGLQVGDRHRALADAQAIYQFWRKMDAQFPPETLAAAQKALLARPSLPAHVDADVIEDIPDRHGVYLFFGENDLPIYVGKSNRLRQRVLSHFASDHALAKEMSISQQVRRIEWIECAGEIDALLTEARLVKERQPTLNRQLRRNRDLCAWQLDEAKGGWLRPTLVQADSLELGAQSRLYGPFKSAKEARATLVSLTKEYGLCQSVLGLEKTPPGKPCFARQLRQCRGACTGDETALQHNIRLMEALGKLRLKAWPFPGPALLREGEVTHVIDAWCHLGTARDEGEVATLLGTGQPRFDRDTYRILVRHLAQMTPLPAPFTTAP